MPPGFEPPERLVTERFTLAPLGPEHNERDHEAWSSSVDHIRATPGFGQRADGWPRPMSLEENLADLELHVTHFRERRGFTYTVLDPDDDVIGCVYVYPDEVGASDAHVRSWVRRSRAELDTPLWRVVSDWLASDAWPFGTVRYERRGAPAAWPLDPTAPGGHRPAAQGLDSAPPIWSDDLVK